VWTNRELEIVSSSRLGCVSGGVNSTWEVYSMG
jgi:hypothetical protein